MFNKVYKENRCSIEIEDGGGKPSFLDLLREFRRC